MWVCNNKKNINIYIYTYTYIVTDIDIDNIEDIEGKGCLWLLLGISQ
jgi:hypothetical protein